MTWELFAFISILTTSVAALLERVLMRDDSSEPISFAIVFLFVQGIISFLLALAFGKFTLPYGPNIWFRYLISGILWAVSTVASLKAMKLLPVAEATIIGTFSAIVSIFFGIFLLHEKVTILSFIGTFLIFLAIWIISSRHLSFKSKTGVIFGFISAIFGGTAMINDMAILKTYEAFSYTTIMCFIPGFILTIFFSRTLVKNHRLFNYKTLKTMVLLAFFYSIQAITLYLALEYNAPISKLSPLIRSSIILTVILAAVFLKERSHLSKKIIAAFIVTLGAVLIG